MITLRQLTLRRGPRILLQEVDLTLHRAQKVGIIGANGSGKSSLFALLLGELHQDAGDLDMPPRLVISHVAQETPAAEASAIDYVIDGDAELREIERALQEAEAGHDGTHLAELHGRFDAVDGYTARARAARLMDGLGFGTAQLDQPVGEFSGGWRMRLNLARALMCRSDLLLLDEPTNHLDLEAVIWLEQWLRSYPGTLLLISHDRDFLDNTVDCICHLEQRQLKLYTGNYAEFERARAANLALQQAAHEKQKREIAHLQSYVDRFRAQATKARQAQSRLKALDRMEIIAAAHVDSPFYFSFQPPQSSPNPLLRLENAAAGYHGKAVVENVSMTLEAGARLGLLGPNGAGKSTLIKLLGGTLAPLSGKREEGKGLKIGYFAQHQLEQLRPDESPLQHMMRLDPKTREQELRDYLGGFDFRGDVVTSPIAPFSGGEKSRLALALLIWQRPNLLLLDEPTNHLDLEMRHALTLALQDYEGALVVVSHDRHLLRTTTDRLVLVADGCAATFDGDLDDYRDWLAQQRTAPNEASGDDKPAGDRKQQKRDAAEQRNRLSALRRPLETKIKNLEKDMDRLTAEKSQLDALLASPEMYAEGSKDKLKESLLRQAQVTGELGRAEESWLALHGELEALED
jgi:ATP-binding cassette subfamily F protein 3